MPAYLQHALGQNLRRERQKSGLTQAQFAALVGVNPTYIGSVERGERNVSLQALERLAQRLEIDPLELLRAESGLDPAAKERLIPRRERVRLHADRKGPIPAIWLRPRVSGR